MSGFAWRKLSAAKWEDVWLERLSEFSDRVAITAMAGSRSIRIQAFQLTRAQALRLVKNFGGEMQAMKREIAVNLQPARPPIKVRGRLVIVGSEHERRKLAAQKAPVLLIPAGMAFGTGDHATTATCLRLLADVSEKLTDGSWEALDLGCGSGILALAARMLGARRAEAGDFDPAAVRIAKENAAANGVRNVVFRKLDVRKWQPARTWPVVVANIYSGLLIEVAPVIARAAAPGGALIFSGILREQEADVIAAFRASGFQIERVVRKGKWVTGLGRAR